MERNTKIDDLLSNLSDKKKKQLNRMLGEKGVDSSKLFDIITDALNGEGEGGFGNIGREESFSDVFSMRDKNKEASRLLKVLKDIKEHGTSGVANAEDVKTLKKMGLSMKDLENSSKNVEKNLKNAKFDNNFGNRLVQYGEIVDRIGNSFSSIHNRIEDILEPWAKANDAASKYAKNVAMSAAGMKAMTKRTINNVVNSRIGINYNMSTDDLIKAQQKYVEGVGRSLNIDNTQQESLAAMTAVMGDKSTELAAAFENFGINLNTTAERSGKMFDKASKTGISFEKLTDNVAKNIKIAQNYTFKNGLKGLESMAAKAVALRMDMTQVAALADKVSSVEGSIDVASKLQVLGGPFASMADPLGMMTESLTDMEGLMDRVTRMVGGLGSFDKLTGEVKVSAFNKQRVKAAAEAMGVSYDSLMESVNAQAKRGEIKKQIGASATAKNLNDDMKELIMNSATFDKNGKAVVSINGEPKSIDELTNNDYKTLIKETQSESDDIKDIARILRSHFDYTEGLEKQKDAVQAQMVSPIGEGVNKLIGFAGRQILLLRIIALAQIAGNATQILSNVNGFIRVFKGGVGFIKNLIGSKIPKASSKILGKGVKTLTTSTGRQYSVVNGKIFNAEGKLIKNSRQIIESANKTMGKDAVSNIMKSSMETTAKNGHKLSSIMPKISKRVANSENVNVVKSSVETGAKRGYKASSIIHGKIPNGVANEGKIVKSFSKPIRKVKQIKNLIKAGKGGKVLASIAKGAGKKIPVVGGLVSAGFEAFENKDKFKNRATMGSAIGKTAGAGVGAVLGGAVGSLLGPIGSVAGAVVGEWVGKHVGGIIGKIQDKRVTKNRAIVDSQLSKQGIIRKGDYSVRNLKKIDSALQTGKMSKRLRKKLLSEGDIDIVSQIESKKNELKEKRQSKRNVNLNRKSRKNKDNESIRKDVRDARFNVSRAYFEGDAFGGSIRNFGNRFGVKSNNGRIKQDSKTSFVGRFGMFRNIAEKSKNVINFKNANENRFGIKRLGNKDFNIEDNSNRILDNLAIKNAIVDNLQIKRSGNINSGTVERNIKEYKKENENAENRSQRKKVSGRLLGKIATSTSLGRFSPIAGIAIGGIIDGAMGLRKNNRKEKEIGSKTSKKESLIADIKNEYTDNIENEEKVHKITPIAKAKKRAINVRQKNANGEKLYVNDNINEEKIYSEHPKGRVLKARQRVLKNREEYVNVGIDKANELQNKKILVNSLGKSSIVSEIGNFIPVIGPIVGDVINGIFGRIRQRRTSKYKENQENEIHFDLNDKKWYNDYGVRGGNDLQSKKSIENLIGSNSIVIDSKGIMPDISNIVNNEIGGVFGLIKHNIGRKKEFLNKKNDTSFESLIESVNAKAKKIEITKQIEASSNSKSLSDDMKEFIKNSATFDKNGKVVVSINGQQKSINELTNNDLNPDKKSRRLIGKTKKIDIGKTKELSINNISPTISSTITLIKKKKNKGNSIDIKAKPENGESSEAKEMQKKAENRASNEKKREKEQRKAEEEQRKSVFNGGKIDVNITGTIKLESGGKKFNLDELMNDSGFKQELAKLISDQIKYNKIQSNIVERR